MFGAEADRNGRSYLHVSIYIFAHLKTKIKRLRIVPRLIYCIDLFLCTGSGCFMDMNVYRLIPCWEREGRNSLQRLVDGSRFSRPI